MSHRATVWAYGVRGLTPAAKLVLVKLADNANDEGLCWPSQSRIAEDCGMPRTSINRLVKILAAKGLLIIRQRLGEGGSRLANHYELLMVPVAIDYTPVTSNDSPVSTDDTPCHTKLHPPVTCRDTIEPSIEPPLEPNPPISPRKRGGVTAEAEYENWWQWVPRKVGKQTAARKYLIARRIASADELLEGIKRYAERRRGEDPQFTMHPSTWLHGGHWTDEYEEPNAEPARDRPTGPPPPLLQAIGG